MSRARSGIDGAVRTLVVWCPDWPVIAAGMNTALSAAEPIAVVGANRVVACSAVARAHRVHRGLRRREAQSRCPGLVIFAESPERDAREFEPVAAAVERLAVGIEVVYPGVVAVPARGVAGYFGGEREAAERLVDAVGADTGVECQVGVADGLFAAILAAHRGAVVPSGGSAEFLAPLGVEELAGHCDPTRARGERDRSELVDLLRRLGLRTLGGFASLTEREVASRFGAEGVVAHRLAIGRVERPPIRRRQPPELAVTQTFDPVLSRIDAAAFAARTLADRLHRGLAAHDLACSRLSIRARTEQGEELIRVWRMAEPADVAGIADRVRWQLEGWLLAGGRSPSSGLESLRLEPDELVSGRALQLSLGGSGLGGAVLDADGAGAERAGRAFARVQGLLGPDGVCTVLLGSGRGPADQVRLVPWGEEAPVGVDPTQTWPGRLPRPSPATVLSQPSPATVLDGAGSQVGVTGRHVLSAAPDRVVLGDRAPRQVLGWSGPWPVEERWWQPDHGRRLARVQVVLAAEPDEEQGQTALLLVRESGRWWVEGVYD